MISLYTAISTQTLKRLPMYLAYLRRVEGTRPNISATAIAEALGLNQVQVRKDLASVSTSGRPRVGYVTCDIIREIETFLGYDNAHDAVLVGAGKLGRALMGYDGFRAYGLNIVAGFDREEAACEKTSCEKPVYPMERMADLVRRLNVHIGIITVPASQAQAVCDQLVSAGVLAIWNFAPVTLTVPEGVLVQSENMAASLAVLSNHLSERIAREEARETPHSTNSGRNSEADIES